MKVTGSAKHRHSCAENVPAIAFGVGRVNTTARNSAPDPGILPRSWHWARAAPPNAAARTRIVSAAKIRLDHRKSLSRGYFAPTFLSSSPPTPASQSGLHELTYGYRSNSAQFTRQPPERSQISSCDECGAFWSDDANGDRARSGLQPQHRSLDARPESC